MPTLVTEQGIVHYETYGRGRPVLLLHGWLGSWELYRDTIQVLGKEFRTYSLDFFGFGDSFSRDFDFSVQNFVQLVNQFLDRLGISKAPIIGHSMGGTVSLGAAIRYPEQVVKVVVIGSPIQGSSLNPILKLSGYKGFANLVWTAPVLLRLFLRIYSYRMARDGKKLGDMIASDTSNVSADSFFQSIGTLRQTDLRAQIGDLRMPVMGVYGKRDIIVNPKQSQVLHQYVPTSRIEWFEGSGHFPMIDEPDRFHDVIRDFLNNG